MTWQSLPLELLQKIILFSVSDVRDIARLSRTCKSALAAASSPRVWQSLAIIRYGEAIATSSEPLYESNWKALMADDNRRGALPTLSTPSTTRACKYRFNRIEYYFCCIVEAVKWDRNANEIKVYIDVRGEHDLREPMTSALYRLPIRGNGWDVGSANVLLPERFVNEVGTPYRSQRRHHKGYLAYSVPENVTVLPGRYFFCYANPNPLHGADYAPVCLFTIPDQSSNGLADAFRVEGEGAPAVYTADRSPFADDTREIERGRWESVVHRVVLDRDLPGPWYTD